MLCLGVESSCDETALALAKEGIMLDSIMASQVDLHSLFGGVVPELASREHYRFIGPLLDRLLERNSLRPKDIDLVAVARGPGLLGSLLVGVGFAKALSLALDVPFIGINHLHAHLLAVGIEHPAAYPALGLLVSGGHTHIYRIESPWRFIQLGTSLDDAAGEAFDKVGKALGLAYPAGKNIDEYAQAGTPNAAILPRPFLDTKNLDFSFSGLKTAALAHIRQWSAEEMADLQNIHNFCASFNMAVTDTLRIKMERAIKAQKGIKQIWLAGGVAANSMLRRSIGELARKYSLEMLVPAIKYCTDNAAMIAWSAIQLAKEGFRHDLRVETIPRGKKIPDDMLLQRAENN